MEGSEKLVMLIIFLEITLFLMLAMGTYLSILHYIYKKKKGEERFEISIYKKLNVYLRNVKEGHFSYESIRKYLKKFGNPLGLTPAGYILLKVLIAVIFMLSFILSKAYVFGIIVAAIGYYTPDIICIIKDKEDMKIIKFELKNIYDSINMQMAAGVFIGKALTECYLIASNKRFKKRLAVLSAEINITQNIDAALTNFSENFNSEEIKNFVLTIKQSLQTGQSKQQIEDMSEELSEMNLIAVQESTKRIDDTVTFIELLIFLGILLSTLYITSSTIMKGWAGFIH